MFKNSRPSAPALELALAQLDHMLSTFGNRFPGDTSVAQHYRLREQPPHAPGANVGWTSGFWTGMLWLAFELTGQQRYRRAASAQAADFAARLAARVEVDHHDLGFLYLASNAAADRIAGLPGARATALAAADHLLTRFLPGAGIIQAWGSLDDPAQRGRVIVDCMMNLPLLHWASDVSGQEHYRAAARSHLVRSCPYLLRSDGSTYHTYHFDADSGLPLRASTHQGLADDSCWARGQAWALYGLALNHRHMPQLGLLDQAARVADYFLAHLPHDRIAYWDLSLPDGSAEPRDSSACAIAACGLFDMAGQMAPGERRSRYAAAASGLLDALTHHCAGRLPEAGGLLRQGTYHRLAGLGVNECTIWGDYYYLEALARQHMDWSSYDQAARPGRDGPGEAGKVIGAPSLFARASYGI